MPSFFEFAHREWREHLVRPSPTEDRLLRCLAWQVTVGALLTVPGNGKEYSAVATVFAGALQVLCPSCAKGEVTNGHKLF